MFERLFALEYTFEVLDNFDLEVSSLFLLEAMLDLLLDIEVGFSIFDG